MDDVTFGRNGPYGDAWKAEPLIYYHYSGVAIPGRSLMSINTLLLLLLKDIQLILSFFVPDKQTFEH